MSKTDILQKFSQSVQQRELVEGLSLSEKKKLHLQGLVGSAFSFVTANAFKEAERNFLLILNDKEQAAYFLNDLENLLGEEDVLFYPASYRLPYKIEETDNANILLRAEVLNRIHSRKKPCVIITYPDALFEKVVTRKELKKNIFKVKVGEELSLDFLNEVLFEYHFKRVDFVTEPGEFSVRGGIIDVFSFSHEEPFRIEFFGDEVDSIRNFDIETQLSADQVKEARIMPNVENKKLDEVRESFLKYISPKTVVFLKNFDMCAAQIEDLFEKAEEAFVTLSKEITRQEPKELFSDVNAIKQGFEIGRAH